MKRLFKNISFLATFDSENSELEDAYIVIEDNLIKEIGKGKSKDKNFDEVIDCKDYLILPGFVNTHHHLYQSLFRNVRGVQSAKLFDWLTFLYEKWKYIDYGASYISSVIANYEMILSGVTTTTDMLYLYPYNKNEVFDAEIEGAKRVGIRFHPTRGSMSLSKKDGGLPPDSVVQTEDEIIKESIRAIEKYHDPNKYSMLRVALAPCSPFSVTEELMKETVKLSKEYDVLIHTHVAETMDEEKFCLEKFGLRPVDYMEKLGWLNPRAWFAHLVWVNDSDIDKLEKNDVGMAHCPASNMRLGSGISPVFKMKNRNIRIGIAVDGSASNDTNNMLQETRLAMLLQRVKYGADALTPRETLKMATVGGSKVLRMDDYVGSLEVGKAADFIGFDLKRLEFAGGLSDPVSAVLLCDAKHVDLSVINGVIKVRQGQILDEELPKLIEKHNLISRKLLSM
jgi:8-oxoguanine deaminase